MILIIGGVYQGKLAYTQNRFKVANDQIYFCNAEDTAMPQSKAVIYEIDRWILALVQAGMDVAIEVEKFAAANQDAVIICNDISCGVVPIDPVMRKWREAVGRATARLAQQSDEVIRLFCGIPSRLK